MFHNQIQGLKLFLFQNLNLDKLGFYSKFAFIEEFDPNDKNEPKIPMEFQIYPVDEVSNIFIPYTVDKYQRFIKEAQLIFNKSNDLENGNCNPNNIFFFYETDDCDLKIEHAHGVIYVELMENRIKVIVLLLIVIKDIF